MKLGLILGLLLCIGCTSKKPATPVDLEAYANALDECKEQGKDAGSYAVYEDCAKQADLKFGRKGNAQ